uniref:Uncharacterized protein n=1 Tax=Acrobeloides nanus TaxID=290746 RepID=A0A914CHI5_9BILA
MFIRFIIFSAIFIHAFAHSIEDFGAVSNDSSNEAAYKNTQAIGDAFAAANQDPNDRTVLLPSGKTFYFFNVSGTNLSSVTLRIEGVFVVSNNITEWENIMGPQPARINDEDHASCLLVTDSENFTLTGNGTIDGQGYDWWVHVWNSSIDHRPFLFRMKHSKEVEIFNMFFKNTPFWTMDFDDMLDLHIHDVDIHVDVVAQKALMKQFGYWNEELGVPTFPLNTDGMDLRGRNVLVENVRIECFDDGIAIKPTNSLGHEQNCSETGVCKRRLDGNGNYANCSQDMLIRNIQTAFTIGMAIGSIPPDPAINCIKNITFENINQYFPIRAAYIKTNPGNQGTGIVDSITFRNFYIFATILIPLYIGPQQQNQPGTNGSNCSLLYPFLSDQCQTQPLVEINNVLFENITTEMTLLIPGVLKCDPVTKCKNVTFINVQNQGPFLAQPIYECHFAEGTKSSSNRLPLLCLEEK